MRSIVGGATLLATWMTAAIPAYADQFDPTDFLERQAYEEGKRPQPVSQSIVVLDGMVFRRLEAGGGSILVRRLDDLSRLDIERAFCPGTAEEAAMGLGSVPAGANSTAITAAELRVANKLRVYGDLIAAAIREKCRR